MDLPKGAFLVSDIKASKNVLIKKYSNRKLYSEEAASYVTLLEIFDLISNKEVETIKVVEKETSKDITKETLVRGALLASESQEPSEIINNLTKVNNYLNKTGGSNV